MRVAAPNRVIHPASRAVAPASKTMARANTVMSAGPTACSQEPHKIASWCCCPKAVSWAPLAPAGGPVLIANEMPSMHVPTRPDTAAQTAALFVNMRVPFCDGPIRVTLSGCGGAGLACISQLADVPRRQSRDGERVEIRIALDRAEPPA